MSCLKCNVLPDKPICKEIEPVGSGNNLTSISEKKKTNNAFKNMAFFPNGETSTLWGNKCNKLIQSPQTFVFLSLENQYTCCNYVLR